MKIRGSNGSCIDFYLVEFESIEMAELKLDRYPSILSSSNFLGSKVDQKTSKNDQISGYYLPVRPSVWLSKIQDSRFSRDRQLGYLRM